jgi:hypothetical protein
MIFRGTCASVSAASMSICLTISCTTLMQTLQFFAPTDAALAKLPQATMDYLLSPPGFKELEKILSYHMVMGVIPSTSLPANSDTTATSLQGSALKVTKTATGQVKVNGMSTVSEADVVSIVDKRVRQCGIITMNNTISSSNHFLFVFWCPFSLRVMELSISLIPSCRCLQPRQYQQHQKRYHQQWALLLNPWRRRRRKWPRKLNQRLTIFLLCRKPLTRVNLPGQVPPFRSSLLPLPAWSPSTF